MATEESSQGPALGPEISEEGGDRPAEEGAPNLDDVLGELMEALSIIQIVSHVLMDASADASEPIGFCALALKHGCEMLDAVYTRFDEGLLGYNSPDDDEPQDPDDLDGAPDEEDMDNARLPRKTEGGERHSPPGKRRGLALAA